MDSTSLKSQIDTDITNKIGAGSILKTDVGTDLKAVVSTGNYSFNQSL